MNSMARPAAGARRLLALAAGAELVCGLTASAGMFDLAGMTGGRG